MRTLGAERTDRVPLLTPDGPALLEGARDADFEDMVTRRRRARTTSADPGMMRVC